MSDGGLEATVVDVYVFVGKSGTKQESTDDPEMFQFYKVLYDKAQQVCTAWSWLWWSAGLFQERRICVSCYLIVGPDQIGNPLWLLEGFG